MVFNIESISLSVGAFASLTTEPSSFSPDFLTLCLPLNSFSPLAFGSATSSTGFSWVYPSSANALCSLESLAVLTSSPLYMSCGYLTSSTIPRTALVRLAIISSSYVFINILLFYEKHARNSCGGRRNYYPEQFVYYTYSCCVFTYNLI